MAVDAAKMADLSELEPLTTSPDGKVFLRSSEEYRQALRDGRRVWYNGEFVEDVTTHPAFSGGVDMVASYFDAHRDGPDAETFVDRQPDGTVTSAAFMLPEDTSGLRRRRTLTEAVVDRTRGTMGRSPEFMPLFITSLYAHRELFLDSDPVFGKNVEPYFRWAQRNHPVMAWGFVDPQSDKRLSAGDRSYLRVVDHRDDGIVISGAKVVATLSAQSDEIVVTTLFRPDLEPESAIWCAVPVSAPGITLVCRDGFATPGEDIEHPLRSMGDEVDAMVLFDNVFVPNHRVFNVGDTKLPMAYSRIAVYTHWYALARSTRRTELYAGAASVIPKVIGTKEIPQVRDMVADIFRYLESCRAFVHRAEEDYRITGGVAHVNAQINNAGRLFANQNYPDMAHTLRELSGQGLIMRFPDAVFDSSEVGPQVAEAIKGRDYTGREKTRLFNLIWDLCCDSMAARLELFDQFNSLSVPVLRQLWFKGYDREEIARMEAKVCGIAGIPTPDPW
jgi:4-hydroxyphenylacetate 3-monooxygenase